MTNVIDSKIESILDYGFITGSQSFGTATEESDWDFCFPIVYQSEVNGILNEYKWNKEEHSDYFNGTKYVFQNKILNIIPVHPHAFKAWYLTTQIVPIIYRNMTLTKIQKYAIFESSVAQIKGYSEEGRSFDDYMKEIKDFIKKENNDIKSQILRLKFLRCFESVPLKKTEDELPF
jgi:hypothetical protein